MNRGDDCLIPKIKKHGFYLLAHEELCKTCFEPLILIYKKRMTELSTENMSMFKELFYKQLTKGQRGFFFNDN